ELLHQREADARAFVRPALDAFDAIEALEKVWQLVLWHADPGVRDAQQRALAVARQAQRNMALERELQRVRKQVENDLLPHLAIDEQRLVECLAVHREFQAGALHRGPKVACEVASERRQVHRLVRSPHSARLDAREVEQRVDELLETFRVAMGESE